MVDNISIIQLPVDKHINTFNGLKKSRPVFSTFVFGWFYSKVTCLIMRNINNEIKMKGNKTDSIVSHWLQKLKRFASFFCHLQSHKRDVYKENSQYTKKPPPGRLLPFSRPAGSGRSVWICGCAQTRCVKTHVGEPEIKRITA